MSEFDLICLMAAMLAAPMNGETHSEDRGPARTLHQAVTNAAEIVARVKDLRRNGNSAINIEPWAKQRADIQARAKVQHDAGECDGPGECRYCSKYVKEIIRDE